MSLNSPAPSSSTTQNSATKMNDSASCTPCFQAASKYPGYVAMILRSASPATTSACAMNSPAMVKITSRGITSRGDGQIARLF